MKLKKDPAAVLDYTFNWQDWLNGDTIASVEWFVTGTLAVDSDVFGANTATAWVSGGRLGQVEELTCRVTTNNSPPRVDDRTIYMQIVQR